jgi:BirA family biotin operon repressor/biotin-[acetyl-CoA-carboxylase] ligase
VDSLDVLFPDQIVASRQGKVIGHTLIYEREVSSTNEVVHSLARLGNPEGIVVLAERQTHGRGRLGRTWISTPGKSLTLSVLLRPPIPPARAPQLTLVTAVALAAGLRSETGLPVQVKWPNDLRIGGRKTGGILTEMAGTGRTIGHVVIGIGLNVNPDPGGFPEEIRHTATSLAEAAGAPLPRQRISKSSWIRSTTPMFATLTRDSSRSARLGGLSDTIGREVTVREHGRVVRGAARGIDDEGFLLVEAFDGTISRVVSGDVSLAGEESSSEAGTGASSSGQTGSWRRCFSPSTSRNTNIVAGVFDGPRSLDRGGSGRSWTGRRTSTPWF